MPSVLWKDEDPNVNGTARWEDTSNLGPGGGAGFADLAQYEFRVGYASFGYFTPTTVGNLLYEGFMPYAAIYSDQALQPFTAFPTRGGMGARLETGPGVPACYLQPAIVELEDDHPGLPVDYRPDCIWRFQLPSIVGNRIFIGYSRGTGSDVVYSSDSPEMAHFGLQFSPSTRGDTTFQVASKPSIAGAQTLTDTGVPPNPDWTYTFRVDIRSSSEYRVELWREASDAEILPRSLLYSATLSGLDDALTVLPPDYEFGNFVWPNMGAYAEESPGVLKVYSIGYRTKMGE